MIKTRIAIALSAAALFGNVAVAGPDSAGQKIDSGLGSLPHYSKWIDKTGRDPMGARILGESLDDGLGSLPHYSKWVDRSGRDPLGVERTALSLNNR
jgi:hypothetical protein